MHRGQINRCKFASIYFSGTPPVSPVHNWLLHARRRTMLKAFTMIKKPSSYVFCQQYFPVYVNSILFQSGLYFFLTQSTPLVPMEDLKFYPQGRFLDNPARLIIFVWHLSNSTKQIVRRQFCLQVFLDPSPWIIRNRAVIWILPSDTDTFANFWSISTELSRISFWHNQLSWCQWQFSSSIPRAGCWRKRSGWEGNQTETLHSPAPKPPWVSPTTQYWVYHSISPTSI